MEKTVAIIGYGNMGSAFAKRLSGFECKILAYDKYKAGFSDGYCQEVSMQQVFEEADIVSFHIPLTWETKGMVTVEYLNKFAKKHKLYLDKKGDRKARKGKKVSWTDGNSNAARRNAIR